MSAVSDHVQLLRSKEQPYEPVFEKMEWLYVNDVQTRYENSVSVIETGALSNSNRFCNYNKAYISVPLLLTVTGDIDNVQVALKQSFLSMVNSITVDLNGVSLVQQNNLIDVINHFELLTTESDSTWSRWSTIGFNPDFDIRHNMLNMNDDELTAILPVAEISKLQQNNLSKEVNTSATDKGRQYSVRAIIYLKDLHPLFKAIPISKSLNFKIQIFWNCSVSTANFGNTPSDTNVWRSYNGSNPIELQLTGTAPQTDIRASVYVGAQCFDATHKAYTSDSQGNVGSQVQLWVPAVSMKPSIEADYLATNSQKMVKYLDYYQYNINDVTPSDNFNKLVSNGITNLKAVLIVPFTKDSKENELVKSDGLPMKYGHLNNLQVIVGGANVLANDLRYSHQTFVQEFINSHGVNSNESPSLGAGMIDFTYWLKRPYYVVDCSRVPDELMSSYRSLQISGTNVTTKTMNLCVFALYERSFSLSTLTGEITR